MSTANAQDDWRITYDDWSSPDLDRGPALAAIHHRLIEVSDGPWALFSWERPAGDSSGAPTVDQLWAALGNGSGWSSVELEWREKTCELTIAFGSYPSTFYGRAIPLTPEQQETADQLEALIFIPGAVHRNCLAVDASPASLAIVTNLWDPPSGPAADSLFDRYSADISDALRDVDKLLGRLSPEQGAAARRLASQWHSGLDELLATVAVVVDEQGTT